MSVRRVLAILLLFCAADLTAAEPCPTAPLPAPTGRYAVGSSILPIAKLRGTGSSRQVQLWYPARSSSAGKPAAYVPDAAITHVLREQKFLDLPECVFDAWQAMKLAARMEASVEAGKFPLVMITPGAGLPRLLYTYYAEQLASDGYIVATIDFGEGGFLVKDGTLLNEGPEIKDEADFAKQEQDMAMHMSEALDEFLRKPESLPSGTAKQVAAHIDRDRIAAVGHSLGGAASLDACAADSRIKACVDMDGGVSGPVAQDGIKSSALILHSSPEYSAADFARLHRDPAQWKAKGEAMKAQMAKLIEGPGPDAWIVALRATGHMSYSDAPFTAPGTLTRFGGTYLDPQRVLTVTVDILEAYFQHVFAGAAFSVKAYPEATVQASRQR